jgi:hypothetical protein
VNVSKSLVQGWLSLPRPPQRARVYAKRIGRQGMDVALHERPEGAEWEFVGWMDAFATLRAFRDACSEALTTPERALTAALRDGPDTPQNLTTSGIAHGARVTPVLKAMAARRKIVLQPMFTAHTHRHQRAKPLTVAVLAEAG